ncbi:alpha/beta hydrolase [Fulvimarina endophytica]|uniref:Palmitoyl-protein thioesterase ABHD10, mitochondrial n=1 Tax=Fulvimarina endophytica TaxID=2293836 RepID=A0A371WYI6_9HYPH|nr:alpha/beta hydrolase [Fulvimarina endophytica]RFC62067.1 alpha/beta hydrolase [Fulvimarina endophytica]
MHDDIPETAHELSVGEGDDRRAIAYRSRAGTGPVLVWLGGYRSDMRGTKAEHLLAYAEATGRGFLRLDYSGHGESGGRFEDGTISRWTEEARRVIEASGAGSVVLVGSSMGAWVALLLTRAARRGECAFSVDALMLLAPAPDFTETLMMPKLSAEDRAAIERDGFFAQPSEYSDEPNIFTKALFEDGARHLVLTDMIETGCPVAIVQGMEDPDVPHTHALTLMERLPAANVTLTLIRDGDHRLSRPQDLETISRVLGGLLSSL